MADLPTPADLVAEGQRSLRADLDPAGTGAVDLSAGSDLDTFLSAATAMMTPVLGHVADRVAARTLSSTTGSDLDEIAQDDFQDSRKNPAAARGFVYLIRPSGTSTTIPKGSRFAVPAAPAAAPVYFGADSDIGTSATKVAIPVTCTEQGAKGNVTVANITKIVDSLPDTTWALFTPSGGTPGPAGETAPAPIGGGADRETDDQLRARLQAVPSDASRQRGTLAAILFGTLRVPGVADAVAIEPSDGSVVVYAGDANYQLPNALKAAIDAELVSWRGYGVPVFVRPFLLQVVQVTASIYMQQAVTAYDTTSLQAAALAAVLAYFSPGRVHPDEYIRALLGAKMAKAIGVDDVQNIVFSAPGSDQTRSASSVYGGVPSLTRYVTDTSHVQLTLLGPATV